MNFETDLHNILKSLKPTTTTIYSSNGDIHHESRDHRGELQQTKVNASSPGYVIDETPDLSVSRILPYLYLGSQDVAHDYNLLKIHKITHILSIGVPSPHYDDIPSTFVKAYDLDEFCILEILPQCFETINSVKEAGGIVYVHCNAGISRSPSVVAAYLVKRNNLPLAEAMDILKNARPKIKPNPGFLQQLASLETKDC